MGRFQTWGGFRHGEVSDMGRFQTWGGFRHEEVLDMGAYGSVITWTSLL